MLQTYQLIDLIAIKLELKNTYLFGCFANTYTKDFHIIIPQFRTARGSSNNVYTFCTTHTRLEGGMVYGKIY